MSKLIRRKSNSFSQESGKIEPDIKKSENIKDNLIVLSGRGKTKDKDIQIDPERMEALKKWRDEELKDYKVQIPDPSVKNPSYLAIAKALIACDGFIMKAAIKLGITYRRINKLIKLNPKLKEIIVDSTEALLDLAESKLKDGILAGDKTCIIFALKCKGRHRNWIEQESPIDVADQKPIAFNYNLVLPEGCKVVTDDGVTIFDNKKDEMKKELSG